MIGNGPQHFKSSVDLKVYYEDTDFSGYVYHANYLKYFDRAREEVFGACFLNNLYSEGFHFVVSKVELNFLYPARYADSLCIVSEGTYSRSPVISFLQRAFLCRDEGGERQMTKELCTAKIDIVILGDKNLPVRMPDMVMEKLQGRFC